MTAVDGQGMVQAGGRLERDAGGTAGREEPAERSRSRHLGAAAPHLRPQASLGECCDLLLQPVAERQLDVRLAKKVVETGVPARLHNLGPHVSSVRRIQHHRQRPILALELVQARGGPDEPGQHPGVLAGAGAAVLVEGVRGRQARRRKGRSVIDQRRQGGAAGVAHLAAVRASTAALRRMRARAAVTFSLKPGRLIENAAAAGSGFPVKPAVTTSAARYVPSGLG